MFFRVANNTKNMVAAKVKNKHWSWKGSPYYKRVKCTCVASSPLFTTSLALMLHNLVLLTFIWKLMRLIPNINHDPLFSIYYLQGKLTVLYRSLAKDYVWNNYLNYNFVIYKQNFLKSEFPLKQLGAKCPVQGRPQW